MSSYSYLDFLIRSKFNFKKAKEYYKYYGPIMELGLFNKDFYLNSYPHIKKANMDPLIHYLFYGYKEGKIPNLYFDIKSYIKEFPEIEDKNLNPLIHYVENKSKGFFFSENPMLMKKNRILDTNSLFLNNYQIDDEPLVSIIILNRNGLNHLQCLFKDFNKKTNYSNYEIIVVDNGSFDKSVEYLYSLKDSLPLKIIENKENLSFSKGNNDAAKIANGEYLLLLNNDIEPTFGWLNEMVGTMLNNKNVGAVGAKLIFPYYEDMDNQDKSFSIQHAGVKFREERTPYIYGPYHENMYLTLLFSDKVNNIKEFSSNTAATLLIPKNIYFELGGFDEGYFYGYEDIDFGFKLLSAGYKTIYSPYAMLFHHESATRITDDKVNERNFKNITLFVEKWGDFLFKELLRDKLENKNYFTNKKLDISIVESDNDKNFIQGIAKNLNKNGYNINLISDINNLDLGKDCDILISFNYNYNIKDVISRLNLIKILVLTDLNENIKYNIEDYDIIVSNSLDNNIKHNNLLKFEFKNSYDFSNELLNSIKEIYLK